MNHHVCDYYLNIMRSVNTGDAMKDYCWKDIWLTYALENM